MNLFTPSINGAGGAPPDECDCENVLGDPPDLTKGSETRTYSPDFAHDV